MWANKYAQYARDVKFLLLAYKLSGRECTFFVGAGGCSGALMKQFPLQRLGHVCSSAVQYGRMVKLLLCATAAAAVAGK